MRRVDRTITSGSSREFGVMQHTDISPAEIASYFDRLWPLNRSITGEGYRQSLRILDEIMPMERLRFATGERVLDWIVPREWNVNEAYIVDPNGVRRADVRTNNLHLVGYSVPFRGELTFDELSTHLHTVPRQPSAIPYLTSYYREYWGFCLSHDEFQTLPRSRKYKVVVDTTLQPGHVEVGEAVLEGETTEEVMLSSYLCHPSLANNELSGPLALAFVYRLLSAQPRRRLTYRFVICPETIGSICFLSVRGDHLRKQLKAGYVLSCIGDRGRMTYKRTRDGHSLADRAAMTVLKERGPFDVMDFDPGNGSDERQYCSPGYALPVGSVMRTPYAKYDEYHTSLDNRQLMDFVAMTDAIRAVADIASALDGNRFWRNTAPFGEPNLGRRGIYPSMNSKEGLDEALRSLFWLLNFSDGQHDILDIAERSGIRVGRLIETAQRLSDAGLLVPAETSD